MAIIRNYTNHGSLLTMRKVTELTYFVVCGENADVEFYCVFTDELAADLFYMSCGIASAEIFADYCFIGID